MPCDGSKDTFPDLQTALIVRDELIKRYAVPMLAYKCLGGCLKWHLTTKQKSGKQVKRWNNIDTETGLLDYWIMVLASGYQPKHVHSIKPREEYL